MKKSTFHPKAPELVGLVMDKLIEALQIYMMPPREVKKAPLFNLRREVVVDIIQ